MASSSSGGINDEGKNGEESIDCEAVDHIVQTRSLDVEQQTPSSSTLSSSPSHHLSPPSSSARADCAKPSQPSRTFSHSLMSNAPDPSVTSRKSKFADSGTTSAVGRASISMPPPIMKPSHHKPLISRQTTAILAGSDSSTPLSDSEKAIEGKPVMEPGSTDDSDKTKTLGSPRGKAASELGARSSPSDSAKVPIPSVISAENDGHRLSFSSLYSLGSNLHSVATGGSGVPSAPSSNAGSVMSGGLDQPTMATQSASSHFASNKLEPSSATTATDPVSVMANSRSPHSGLRISRDFMNESHFWLTLLFSTIEQYSVGFIHDCVKIS